MNATTASTPSPTLTPRGTPCAASWDAAWRDTVIAAEEGLARRICGAKTATGQPCAFEPCANGRCRFHGGADLAGGQPGNRNAATHGLYARGLRPCSARCPHWASCPLAGDDVKEIAAANRPVCPYESQDFESAVDGLTQMVGAAESPQHVVDLAHRVAVLHVMVNRTAAALRETDMADSGGASDAAARIAKPHAYLQAYLRLSNEYRRYLALLQQHARDGGAGRARREVVKEPSGESRANAAHGVAPESRALERAGSRSTLPAPAATANDRYLVEMDGSIEPANTEAEQSGQIVRFPRSHGHSVGPIGSPMAPRVNRARDLEEALDHRAHRRYREAIIAFNRAMKTCRDLALPHHSEFQQLEVKIPPCAPEKRIIVMPK